MSSSPTRKLSETRNKDTKVFELSQKFLDKEPEKDEISPEENSEKNSLYDIFKQASPLLPLGSAIYQLIMSGWPDNPDTYVFWFQVCLFASNIAIILYTCSSLVIYLLFKKSKGSKKWMERRENSAGTIRTINTVFLWICGLLALVMVFSGLISTEKIIASQDEKDPNRKSTEAFVGELFTKHLALALTEILFLYGFLKKYYKLKKEPKESPMIQENKALKAKIKENDQLSRDLKEMTQAFKDLKNSIEKIERSNKKETEMELSHEEKEDKREKTFITSQATKKNSRISSYDPLNAQKLQSS